MRNTTIRLATGLSVLMLGAFAIALAQYDARNRTSEPSLTPAAEPKKAVPIAVREEDSPWIAAARMIGPDAVVRGNDGQSGQHEASFSLSDDDNPLRAAPLNDSKVVLVSDTQPVQNAAPAPTPMPLPSLSTPENLTTSLPSTSTTSWPSGANKLAQPPRNLASEGTTLAAPALPPQLPSTSAGMRGPSATLLSPTPSLGDSSIPARPNSLATIDSPASQLGTPAAPLVAPNNNLPTNNLPTNGSPTNSLPTNSLPNSQPPALGMPVRQSLSDTQQPMMRPTDLANPGSIQPGSLNSVPSLPSRADFAQGEPATTVAPSRNSLTPSNGPLGLQPQQPNMRPMEPTNYAGQPSNMQPRALPASSENRTSSTLASGQSRSTASVASLVSNEPGSRFLDGPQNGSMLIQKRIPEEIQVGRKAPVVITVRNAGSTTAHEVMVVDRIPRGAEFVDAHPEVTPTPDGVLVWHLGEMVAGDERTINLQMIPRAEGDIGSTFSVYSAVQGSVRTIATLPKLEITHAANPESLIGAQQEIKVTIRNIGSGIARNVRMEADLPKNLRHSSGEQHLETILEQLHPNQSVTIPLACIAAEAGPGQTIIRAVIDESVEAQHQIDLQVVAPSLQVSIEGPKVRYLERPAVYQFHVQNSGSAPATNCDFALRLPNGLKYIEASNFGEYDPSQHAVFWSLESIPHGKTASTDVKLLPVETGPQLLAFQATADLGIKVETKGQLVVQGQAELAFTIEEDSDPIETGSTTTYSVTVSNLGSRPDQNIQLLVQIPDAGRMVQIDPALKYDMKGNVLRFEPITQMESRDQRVYRFEVQYNAPGTHVVRAQLTSQNWTVPVIKEEGTHVYNDRE